MAGDKLNRGHNNLVKHVYQIPILFFLASFVLTATCRSQSSAGKFWVRFTDKANSPYSIDHPEEFLSDRAILRRLNQGIPIVENDLPVNPHYIDSLRFIGIKVLNRSKWFNAVTTEIADTSLPGILEKYPFISTIQQVFTLKERKGRITKFDEISHFSGTEGTRPDYGPSANQIMMLNGHVLHDLGYRGKGMQIAVIDAGFIGLDYLPAFDSLRINNQIIGTRDFVDGDDEVYDAHPHGMVVTSVMGGNWHSQIIGTAPQADYLLLRSEDGRTEFLIEEDNWIAAAEYADSFGVDLINTSLGYSLFDDPDQDHDYTDMDGNSTRISIGADIAASKGILVITSAGNEGNDPWHYITAPADADSVCAVGAVDQMGQYVSFSSTGPTYDERIKPNVAAMGEQAVIQGTSGTLAYCNGTSCAAPVITGLAACLWQANRTMTNMEILRIIEQSSNQSQSPDSLTGYGLPDFALALTKLGIDLPEKYLNVTNVFPNPFTDQFTIRVFSLTKQKIRINLIDLKGRMLNIYPEINLVTGNNEINIQHLGHISGGFYTIQIITPDNLFEIKVVKL